MALGLGVEVGAEAAGALVKEDLGHGVSAAEVAGRLTTDTSAAGSEKSGSVERIVQSRGCATGGGLCDRFAARCSRSASYGLLGATGRKPLTEASDCISDTHAKRGPITPAFDVALRYAPKGSSRDVVLERCLQVGFEPLPACLVAIRLASIVLDGGQANRRCMAPEHSQS